MYFNQVADSMIRAAHGIVAYTPQQMAEATAKAKEQIRESNFAIHLGNDVIDAAARVEAVQILDKQWLRDNPNDSQLFKNIKHYIRIILAFKQCIHKHSFCLIIFPKYHQKLLY